MREDNIETIRRTTERVGQLVPVLVNQKGEVIDGRHRLKAVKGWKRTTVNLDELQTHVARLVINSARRVADRTDYNELAEYLMEAEGLKKGQIANRIIELTQIPKRTVWTYLDAKYKHEGGEGEVPTHLGESEPVSVPLSLVPSVQRLTETIRDQAATIQRKEIPQRAKDEQVREVVKKAERELAVTTSLVKASTRTPIKLPERDPSTYTFLKQVTALSLASTFLLEIPVGMIVKIVQDMEPERQQTFKQLAKNIVRNSQKLQEVLQEL